MASWYGRKFHGQRTSTGEVYDMFAMTAAHPTLPLPSYARVTSVASGRSVVVRVNDRGPFLHGRIVDLSYAAAHRLGIAQRGSGEVIVESLLPGGATVASVAPALVAPVPAARRAARSHRAAGPGRGRRLRRAARRVRERAQRAELPRARAGAARGGRESSRACDRPAGSTASTSARTRRATTRGGRPSASRARSASRPRSHRIELLARREPRRAFERSL